MQAILKWLIGLAALAVVAGGGMYLYARHEARSDPVVRRARLALSGWPEGAKPVTVALLSDIHIGSGAMDAERLTRIADQIAATHPDLVLIAGDFIYGHDPAESARLAPGLTAPLARLRPPLGVIAVPGNHDHWTGAGPVRRALEAAGVTVLANQAVRRGPLTILGFDDSFSGHADVAATLRSAAGLGGVAVALTHSPGLIPRLPPSVNLLLAGHTHCGQVVFPLIGAATDWPDPPKRLYDPRYRCGVVHDPERTVIVTAGMGTSGPALRLGAPPDFWLLTLVPAVIAPTRKAG
ncbi:metallophosphoesterase [Sphingomonas sp. KR3-1]|uniref:metallophosphoesterase n=1 Tax=Sphingomonas sp. KR3-1 TaxID=3156611 RepID=UPI0032B51D08